MDEASVAAHKYQVPVNQIRRDLGDDLNLLARFGTRNRQVMLESAGRARTYGMSIKDINTSFGEQMDTFDKTSDIAAKLNSVFGTHINSYQLMLETNPVKRMEMLRKELLSQGKSWDKLNVFEQNVIASTLEVSKEQAALGLSSDSARKKLQKQADQQARTNKINKDWDKGLGNVKETLVALQPKLDKMLINVANIVSKLFGFESGNKGIQDTAKTMNEFLDNINIYLETKFFKSPGGRFLAMLFGINDIDTKNFSTLEKELKLGSAESLESKVIKEGNKNSSFNLPAYGHANDALVTKTGEVIKFNPQDNIIATKSPISRSAQGATATAGRGSGGGDQNITITPAPIYLDGKKIADAIFRQTRR